MSTDSGPAREEIRAAAALRLTQAPSVCHSRPAVHGGPPVRSAVATAAAIFTVTVFDGYDLREVVGR